MGPKTIELIAILEELEDVLQAQEDVLWKGWVTNSRSRLMASDYSGIEKLLSAYGGMGSFNDLVVGYYQKDGITHQRKGYGEANQVLSKLRNKAWKLATEIKREYKKTNT